MKKIFLFGCIAFLTACSSSNDPHIDSVSPDRGSMTGGTTVTIEGSNFVNIIAVEIGNVDCETFDVVSENEITCITGPNPGVITNAIVDVEVLNENGDQGALDNAFTYTNP